MYIPYQPFRIKGIYYHVFPYQPFKEIKKIVIKFLAKKGVLLPEPWHEV